MWTVLELKDRWAPPGSCCAFCNPQLLERFSAPKADDPRLSTYASDFIFPLHVTAAASAGAGSALPPTRRPHADSIASNTSHTSTSTTHSTTAPPTTAIALPMSQAVFVPLKGQIKLPQSQHDTLRAHLETWRVSRQNESPHSFLSLRVYLPDEYIDKLLEYGSKFLHEAEITPPLIRKIVQWNLASERDLNSICKLISDWRLQAKADAVPGSGRGRKKTSSRTGSPAAIGRARSYPTAITFEAAYSTACTILRSRSCTHPNTSICSCIRNIIAIRG